MGLYCLLLLHSDDVVNVYGAPEIARAGQLRLVSAFRTFHLA
jgi:hypothetical protein